MTVTPGPVTENLAILSVRGPRTLTMDKFFKSLVIYVIAGPIIGLLTLLCIRSIVVSDLKIFNLDMLVVMTFAYGIGIIPAVISGLLYQYPIFLIEKKAMRIIISMPIGAVAMFTWIDGSSRYFIGYFGGSMLYSVLFGAFVSLLCSIIIELCMPSARLDKSS
ncbi:hypothetical protein [Methylobacterium sp. Leaf89]|uniref:hypothetical protein n=1 Tax=Methylobacterium sp. Leaf89 TaxID=1736245 RepID=UPI0012E8B95B|nr:hypothetical protein [Methylobacterium sp. Leaf89]